MLQSLFDVMWGYNDSTRHHYCMKFVFHLVRTSPQVPVSEDAVKVHGNTGNETTYS